MKKLVRQRLLALPVLLFGVTLVVFLSVQLIPGDPAEVIGGNTATPEQIAEIREDFGLDEPLPAQYARYVGRLLRGDLGESLFVHRPVTAELGDRMPASIELAVAALAIGVPIGALLGVAAAVRRDGPADYAATTISLIGLSVPTFWVGLMLAWIVGVELGWLPFSGRLPPFTELDTITGFVTLDAVLQGEWALLWQALRHLALPAITLSFIPMALIARYTRSGLIEALGQDYIRTARAYGLPNRQIVWRYATKNAMLPLVTLFGALVPALLAGAVLVESVFGWPGMGTFLLTAINTRDYPVIQSVTLVFALLYIVINLLVDLSYGLLDPRIRES